VGINAALGCRTSTAAVRSAVGICEGRMLLMRKLELCDVLKMGLTLPSVWVRVYDADDNMYATTIVENNR
jgi:hypothetical protein